MDFLAELCGEILDSLFSWLTESQRIPKSVRMVIASIPHIALLILFGLLAYQADSLTGMLICIVCCILSLTTWFLLLRKIYRS